MKTPKTYRYFCIARTGGMFAIVDIQTLSWCYMYRSDVKDMKKEIMFSEKKETYMRPFNIKYSGAVLNQQRAIMPSTYFNSDSPKDVRGLAIENNVTNRLEDLWVVPYDTFLEFCGNDPNLTALLLLYGSEAFYDNIILKVTRVRYVSRWGVWESLT